VWHRGRVARQRTANPRTAVRFRPVPQDDIVAVAELVYAFDLKSNAARLVGSSPTRDTIKENRPRGRFSIGSISSLVFQYHNAGTLFPKVFGCLVRSEPNVYAILHLGR
jgi:hypothetical protein